MNPRLVLPLAVLVIGAAIALAAFLLHPSAPTIVPKVPPPATPAPAPPAAPAPAPTEAAPPAPSDPNLRAWRTAIQFHDEKSVLRAQSAFLAKEEEYREPLAKMAKEDADPRVRAFCVAVLGRMKTPPPEAFFLDRLDDASEHPRRSCLHAIEKLGTAAALPKLDRLATSDPVESVRADAARAAKAVRSR
jgi:HEAT repeat protein